MTGGADAPYDVAVLGAGPAGVGAALRLAAVGRSVVVLERAAGPGGLAGSFEVDGVRVDHGSHRLHPSCAPAILDELRALLGDDLQLRQRHGRIRLAGRWVAFPPRLGDLARHLPPVLTLRLARDAATGPLRRPRADTFAEVVRAGLGPTMLDAFYAPYVEKIWGKPATELDGELARRRVGARGAGALLARVLRPSERARRGVFFYPRRGYGQITEALAAAAEAAGADLRFGAEVESVDLDGAVPQVQVSGGPIHARSVWSTLPVPVLARLAGAPAEVQAQADALRYRALALVYLVLDRDRYTEFDAHYFPERDVLASRLSEPKNYRNGGTDDPTDRTVLCAEVPCSVGDEVWGADDAALADRVAADLARCGLPDATPLSVVVRRVPHAYPMYTPGFEEALSAIEAWADAQPRLLTFGRQGLFAHDNTHHALASAWAAADSYRGEGEVDRARWTAARESFRAHVVED